MSKTAIFSLDSKNRADKASFNSIVTAFASSKSVVMLVGAGISCSAGIPDFRSSKGIYKAKGSNINLFDISTLADPISFGGHTKMISKMKETISKIDSTPTHAFMKLLKDRGQLLRVYSQNIDGLEGKAGLEYVQTEGRISKGKGKGKELDGDVVSLHGSIDFVRCNMCQYVGELDEVLIEDFSDGLTQDCPDCVDNAKVRSLAGKRSQPLKSFLRPSITLYGEQSQASDTITNLVSKDLGSVDVVLVMGTSLKIPGFKSLVKEFALSARINRSATKIVLVGNEINSAKEWNGIFDYQVIGTCDGFVFKLLSEWKRSKPDQWRKQSTISFEKVYKEPVSIKSKRSALSDVSNSPCPKKQKLAPTSPGKSQAKRATTLKIPSTPLPQSPKRMNLSLIGDLSSPSNSLEDLIDTWSSPPPASSCFLY